MLTEIKTIPETFFVARPNLFSRKYYFRLENKKNVMDDFVQSTVLKTGLDILCHAVFIVLQR